MNYYRKVLQNYATFTGRARRSEFWYFVLFNLIFGIIAMTLDNLLGLAYEAIGYGPIYGLYALAVLVPGIAVAVRRLHDIDKSGWYVLINLIPIIGFIWFIVLAVKEGTPGTNQYGINPKESTAEASI